MVTVLILYATNNKEVYCVVDWLLCCPAERLFQPRRSCKELDCDKGWPQNTLLSDFTADLQTVLQFCSLVVLAEPQFLFISVTCHVLLCFLFRCGGREICPQLRLSELFRGLHSSDRPDGACIQHRNSLYILHSRQL